MNRHLAVLRRAQPWLGTLVELAVVAAPELDAAAQQAALDAAFAVVAHIHKAMSPQTPGSDLARFNAPGRLAFACDAHTATVLAAAQVLAGQSLGAFDASQGHGGLAGWRLEGLLLTKLLPHARLDLGGIAKGYAVDCAAAALQAAGVAAGWVNAGGDLCAFGDYDHAVHLRSPLHPSRTRPLLALREGALATSLLPRANAEPAHVSVAAPSCLFADALTKVVAYAEPAICQTVLNAYAAHAWRHEPF